jgi:hypothetical protein
VTDDPLPARRASDQEREQAALALREGLVEGRLTLEEFSARLDRVYAAKTQEELAALSADLAAPPFEPVRAESHWLVSAFGGLSRRGRWRLAANTRVVAVAGGCQLDLRGAVLESTETTIACVVVMGGLQITVPRGIEVEVTGFSLFGGKDANVGPAPPGAPRLHVRVFNLMGGVSVGTRPARASAASDADRVPDGLQLEEG